MKVRSIVMLIFFVLVAAGLGALSYFGIGAGNLFGYENIKQGLDLQGGVSILYEADIPDPTAEEMKSALSMIRGRLDRKNYTEAEVAIQGANRLFVQIPGVDDAETAIKEIGQTALLMFADEEGQVLLTGSEVVDARKEVQQRSQGAPSEVVVVLNFSETGKALFEEATGNNIGKPIHIMLDAAIISSPTVNEKIIGGNAIITGGFTPEYAEELAALIRAGSLPFSLNVIDMNNVGARLGADSLSTSLIAGAIGAALVLLFMLIIYRVSGLAADLALIIFVTFELVVLSLFGITLTLPGMAGIILSIGMAVDANVIIFERIREEINSGRSLRSAVTSGFSRAFPAILDGNVTTLIAAAVLFWLGTGPIKGFAQTLSIGIIISMFTALVITRFIIQGIVGLGLSNPKFFGAKNK